MPTSPLRVEHSDELGRYYVAARTIAEGEIVLSAAADVWAPASNPLVETATSEAERVALRHPSVAEAEAAIPAGLGLLDSGWLLFVRALLRGGAGRASDGLGHAMQPLDANFGRWAPAQSAAIHLAALHLLAAVTPAMADPPRLESMERLVGTVLTNAFGTSGIPTGEAATASAAASGGGEVAGFGLFSGASLFNHSCAPNVHVDHSLSRTPGQLSFRAEREIQAGAPVCISYIDVTEARHVRRALLRRGKAFECACARCEDPTDFDRCGDALQCDACGRGWMRQCPGAGSEAKWRCCRAESGCAGALEAAEVAAWEASLRRRLDAADCLDDPRGACDAVLVDALRRCHPNHGLALQARLRLPRTAQSHAEGEALARAALAVARRLAGRYDEQLGDLSFQIGLACHQQVTHAQEPRLQMPPGRRWTVTREPSTHTRRDTADAELSFPFPPCIPLLQATEQHPVVLLFLERAISALDDAGAHLSFCFGATHKGARASAALGKACRRLLLQSIGRDVDALRESADRTKALTMEAGVHPSRR